MQKQLSMFFRNQRRLSKKPKGKENTPENQPSSSAKKIRLDDDVLAAKRNLDLLKKTKKTDFSKDTFDTLVGETFKRRRQFIQHEAKSVNEILQQCPFLSDPVEVSIFCIIGQCMCRDVASETCAASKIVLIHINSECLKTLKDI